MMVDMKSKPANPPQNSRQQEINPNISNKKCKKYFMLDSSTKIYFNADFDSGNLQKVQQVAPYIYKLYPGYDRLINSTNKTYFHFKVFGFKMCTVRFIINRLHILEKLLKNQQQACYKPVVRKGKGKYEPIQRGVKIYLNNSDQAQLSIDYEFGDEQVWTYFSFSYPYSYEDMLNMVKELKLKYVDHPEIYFHEEVLGYSQEGRKLQIISITEKINCSKQRSEDVKQLFPDRASNLSMAGFKINKPKIMVSGRVHPGETPASHCIEGLLRFLLDEKDYRAYLLRKNFHFIIIPMLNPDGVYHGMFRNDINGENLNRLYVNCQKQKHPTIWCFRQYLKSLQLDDEPVLFYFDFHAHPSKKQFFIYGNAFTQFIHQVEAETFGRLLENNCPYFHNIDSIFTEKQMASKDKYDVHTKQGCARVYVHRLFNIIHSYTVECGYFAPGKLQSWQSVESILKRAQVFTQEYGYVGQWEQCSTKKYTPESYMLMGKSILVTILDLFHLNPYSRINLSELRSIATIRKNVGIKIYNSVERFRMIDPNVTKKLRELTKLLQQEYYKERVGQFALSISENYGMKHPKKKFSLMSRVYMSKKQIQFKLNTLDPETNEPNEQMMEDQTEADQQENEFNLYTNDHQIIEEALVHSTNFRHFKSQLQLKIPKIKHSDKKLQESYLNQISHECLHVSKAKPVVSDLYNIEYSNNNNTQHVIDSSILNSDKNDGSNLQQIMSERRLQKIKDTKKIIIEKSLGKPNRRESQMSLNFLKIESKPKKRNETEGKVQRISYSQQKKQDQNKKATAESKIDILMNLKAARIDKFLKKQSDTVPINQKNEVEKYITNKVQQEINKSVHSTNSISRFPSIYTRQIESLTSRAQK